MITVDIKPMSVNEAWKGRRFKTEKYKEWRDAMLLLLPVFNMPKPPFVVYYEFGLSSANSDFDNPIKCLTDALQERYGFNDKLIEEGHIRKVKVAKGAEYIKFDIFGVNDIDRPTTILDKLLMR